MESKERGSVGRPSPDGFQRERLDRALARASDAPLREGNRLELLRNGPDTYEDWLAAISGAERWVHLERGLPQQFDAMVRQIAVVVGVVGVPPLEPAGQ